MMFSCNGLRWADLLAFTITSNGWAENRQSVREIFRAGKDAEASFGGEKAAASRRTPRKDATLPGEKNRDAKGAKAWRYV